MKQKIRNCIVCGREIDTKFLAFEQRLTDDKDFCKRCWEEIM